MYGSYIAIGSQKGPEFDDVHVEQMDVTKTH